MTITMNSAAIRIILILLKKVWKRRNVPIPSKLQGFCLNAIRAETSTKSRLIRLYKFDLGISFEVTHTQIPSLKEMESVISGTAASPSNSCRGLMFDKLLKFVKPPKKGSLFVLPQALSLNLLFFQTIAG